jgi:obg-like ATPase 1
LHESWNANWLLDILAKTIISEEAVVRKAGGKFKMNPLFPSTVAKIKAVRASP